MRNCCPLKVYLIRHYELGYEQMVYNSFRDPSADPGAELVIDARSRGRQAYWLIMYSAMMITDLCFPY